jgi:hypothetical protein
MSCRSFNERGEPVDARNDKGITRPQKIEQDL